MAMSIDNVEAKSLSYLTILCSDISERCVGSEGNREATRFFLKELQAMGWQTEIQEFNALDWEDDGASLSCDGDTFRALVSPYSKGCKLEARLTSVSSLHELESTELKDSVVLIHGDLAREQLMPKNFVFYNPKEHQQIIALLEQKSPAAIISATTRCGALAGGVYPFPLIEDGDFDIPSVYMTEEEGARLLDCSGETVRLVSNSRRIPGKGCNVIGKKPAGGEKRIVITAHIDAKKGTPGAIDNATGVVSLLLLAHLLRNYEGRYTIELVALNGEDYYAASGQMKYLEVNAESFDEVFLNINIDGAGYHKGGTYFSLFSLPITLRNCSRISYKKRNI